MEGWLKIYKIVIFINFENFGYRKQTLFYGENILKNLVVKEKLVFFNGVSLGILSTLKGRPNEQQ